MMKSVKDKKNGDIQLLRAAAIIAVLGFHLRPSWVPQGYLGVDIFFAISGYLMTVILNGKVLTLQTCLRFYERRLKRLLPAYLMVIFGTLLITSFFLISTAYDFLKIDTLWSMFFVTNFQSILEKRTYFLLVNDFKFLLHTWSLSVEIQYYFIVPFIVIPISWSPRPLTWLIPLSLASWSFQTFIPYPTISFGLVLSRIWQFLIGSIVYYLHQASTLTIIIPEEHKLMSTEDSRDMDLPGLTKKKSTHIKLPYLRGVNFMLIFIICFMPEISKNFLYVAAIRLIATAMGGGAIYLGTQSSSYGSCSMLAKLGTYLGDISYSVYLVHWPVVILAKYCGVFESTPLWQLLGTIFAISMTQYHFFEKPILHLSSKLTFIISGLLYLGLITLLIQPQAFGYSLTTIDPAVEGNEQIAKTCNQLPMNKDCNWDPEMLTIVPRPKKSAAYFCSYDGNGNATVFFTGNSYALRQLAGVKKALKGQYKKLYFAARPACLAFESFNKGYEAYWQCDEIDNKTIQFLEKFKPDLLIISQKISGNDKFAKAITPEAAKNDSATKEVARYFSMFSKFTKNIMVIEPHPTCPYNPATTLAKEIAQGKNISERYLSKKRVLGQVDPGWIRIKAAMANCPTCTAIDVRDAYFDHDKYYVYDKTTKLSLFCDNNHFSHVGVDRMLPALKKAFKKALNY